MHRSGRESVARVLRRAVPVALVALASVAGSPAAMAGGFQAVGAMAEPRWEPVVVTLADGSALVIGGWKKKGEENVGIAGVERFDPATNQFSAVGSMAQPHLGHAAVRLADGRVFVIGGVSQFATGAATEAYTVLHAELYDPATTTFARAGKMAGIRGNPTLNVLPDGRVLVAGGWTNNQSTPASEIFDPATGEFTPGPPLVSRRYRHSSVTLPDGRVVLIGGYTLSNEPVRRVEIYDPKSAAFQAAGNLIDGRGDTTAVLLPDGRILVAGGTGSNGRLNSVEIYDVATQKSTIVARLPRATWGNNTVMLQDGRVLVVGGTTLTNEEEEFAPAQLFVPATAEVLPAGPMAQPRDVPGATLLGDGRVLIVGGWGFDASGEFRPLATAELYVP